MPLFLDSFYTPLHTLLCSEILLEWEEGVSDWTALQVVGGDILYSLTSALRCIELVVLQICPVLFLEAQGPRDYAGSKFISLG